MQILDQPRPKLREWRLYRGMRKFELARKAGLSDECAYVYERENAPEPQPKTLVRLADALGVTVFDLYRNP